MDTTGASTWRARLETARGGAGRLASMEGLRGLAVLLVFFVHYTDLVGPWIGRDGAVADVLWRLADAGNVGVDLFFVLSGFLIYGSLMDRPQAYRPFIRRRARRIFPTFLVVFAAYVVLSFAVPSESNLPANSAEIPLYLLVNLLLLPGIVPVEAFITVAWSLSYEFFFYLTVPLLISRLRLRDRDPAWRMRLLAWFAVGFLLLGGVISGTHPRLSMFFGGMLLWEWLRHRWPARAERADGAAAARRVDRWGLVALAVGVLAPLVLTSGFALGLPRIATALVAFPVLCAACFAVEGRCRRWFCWTPLRLLGNVSYSYYLVHSLVLQAIVYALELVWAPTGDATWAWFALLVPSFAATVVGAVVLFLTVEQPFSLAGHRPAVLGRLRRDRRDDTLRRNG